MSAHSRDPGGLGGHLSCLVTIEWSIRRLVRSFEGFWGHLMESPSCGEPSSGECCSLEADALPHEALEAEDGSGHSAARYGEGVKKVGHYFLTKTLGQGAFSKVKLGIHDETEEKVAVKVMKKSKLLEEGLIDQVKREISSSPSLLFSSFLVASLTPKTSLS